MCDEVLRANHELACCLTCLKLCRRLILIYRIVLLKGANTMSSLRVLWFHITWEFPASPDIAVGSEDRRMSQRWPPETRVAGFCARKLSDRNFHVRILCEAACLI